MLTSRIRRSMSLAAALSVTAVVLSAGAVNADTETGTHGNYLVTDAAATPGGTCVYVDDGAARFHRMNVLAPSIWWPDSNASNNNEHGVVGWSFELQHYDNASWVTVRSTNVQKGVAHEDSQNPYDPSTKAHLAKMHLNVNYMNYPVETGGSWRAIVKAMWFKPNGKVLGTVTHEIVNYRFKVAGAVTGGTDQGYCINAG